MARTASFNRSLTYAFSFGFLAGQGHGRMLGKLLRREGYVQARDLEQADIIVAHSAGCWMIPLTAKPKLVIFIGMPLAQSSPSRTFVRANRQKMRSLMKSLQLTRASQLIFYSTYYGFTQISRNRNIIRTAKHAQPVVIPTAKHIFIANRYDPWPHAKKLQSYIDKYNWTFVSMPGVHDDIWQQSNRYMAIINYYARLLV